MRLLALPAELYPHILLWAFYGPFARNNEHLIRKGVSCQQLFSNFSKKLFIA